MNANELADYMDNLWLDECKQASTMLRQQQEKLTKYKLRHAKQRKRIDELEVEMDIVIKLLCGEQISDDLMVHWNPLHSTLKSKLLKAQEK